MILQYFSPVTSIRSTPTCNKTPKPLYIQSAEKNKRYALVSGGFIVDCPNYKYWTSVVRKSLRCCAKKPHIGHIAHSYGK